MKSKSKNRNRLVFYLAAIGFISLIFGLKNKFLFYSDAKVNQEKKPISLNSNTSFKNTKRLTNSLHLFLVSDFGAKGDGIVDDTKAIQKAIDKAHVSGGGVVLFQVGEYKIKVQANNAVALTIYPNIELKGQGYRKSTIKIADNQGNYDSMIAGASPASDLSDFSLHDLNVDGNSQNNYVSSENDFKDSKFRYAVRIFSGKNIRIYNCRFSNFKNVNVITANGSDVANVDIYNNLFESIGGGPVEYDHSTIYMHGIKGKIFNNLFSSKDGAGTRGARTAIEIHGDSHIVSGNQINGFTNGIFITGFAVSSKNQTVINNTIKNVHSGIIIWSYYIKKNEPKTSVEDCTISGNKIFLNVAGWRELWGNSPNQGIALEGKSDSSIKNIKILKNEIIFTDNDIGRTTDTLANGINLWRYSHPNIFSYNIYIHQNRIINSLSSGIYIAMPIDNLEILGNEIINPGQSKQRFDNNYFSGMILGTNKDTIVTKDNIIVDNQLKNTLKIGIVFAGICSLSCIEQNNQLKIKSGAKVPLVVRIK
jgi:Pectate lyase superfamily protein